MARKRNSAELLVLGTNPKAQKNPAELLVLGANPSPVPASADKAADLYTEFHGKAPTEVLEVQRSAAMRMDYTALGDLETLVFVLHGFDLEEYEMFREDMEHENGNLGRVRKPTDSATLSFEARDKVKVASNPDGTQLYLLGGNQDLGPCLHDLGVDASKDLIDLGYCICIRYIAFKTQDKHRGGKYWHILGEESNQPPRLFYDRLKREMAFAGGAYVVRAPGIIN
jgi:hypothetical protein